MAKQGATATVVKTKGRPLAKIIAEAPDMTSLMRVYNLMKFRGAAAGNFDFKSDFMAYKFYVEGRVDDLRKLCNTRLKTLGECAKRKLGDAAMDNAKEHYQINYRAYAKKIVGKETFPKYLIKIRGGIAYFANDPNRREEILLQPSLAPWVDEEAPTKGETAQKKAKPKAAVKKSVVTKAKVAVKKKDKQKRKKM